MHYALRANLVIEHVDNDVLVLDGQTSTVHRFSGSHAEAIKHLYAGDNTEAFSAELADFDAAGLLKAEGEASTVSRRGVLFGGAALAGSAAVAMSMPAVANAQSITVLEGLDITITHTVSSGGELKASFTVDLPAGSVFGVGQTWTLVVLEETRGGVVNVFDPPRTATATVTVDPGGDLRLEYEDVDVLNTDGFGIDSNIEYRVQLERGDIITGVIFSDLVGS